MKLITFTQGADPRPGLALSENVGIDLLAADPSLPANWHVLFGDLSPVSQVHQQHVDRLVEMETLIAAGQDLPMPFVKLGAPHAVLLAPVILPSKIICVGLNYRDHAEEQNKVLPANPMLFSKAATCLQAPDLPICIGEDLGQVDAEGELAVIIGRAGRAIKRENAANHIAGYTCFNDVSDREAQYADKQYFRGKSIDTGGPCGPWIVTPDELPEFGHGLDIECRWNGEVMQKSNTKQLIFPVDHLISYVSKNMTLLPGDIISTGTPGGVGVFRDPPVFLQPGDVVEVEIAGIGILRNPVQRWTPSG
ncbi:MAG: fumarylacetoacetate hydrolase family protein [Candidatus Krumholzibacteria bacterium]|nr:fumarylacetoacetate hydrolase family protein [Candidatus Krumholzibacteria bacterium]